MTFETFLRRGIAGVALTAAFGAAPLAAQEESADTSGTANQAQSGTPSNASGSGQSIAPETVLAMVGDSEIMGAEVIEFISALPPRMREQPPQVLASMALDQVILRELLLQEAQSQNLSEDPRVTEIVDQQAELAQEDAMVAVLLEDELAERVSAEQVQQAYDQLQTRTADGQNLPPLDALRPQIEQQLQQQAVRALRDELMQDADVVVYGAEEPGSGASAADSGSDDQ